MEFAIIIGFLLFYLIILVFPTGIYWFFQRKMIRFCGIKYFIFTVLTISLGAVLSSAFATWVKLGMIHVTLTGFEI